MILLLLLGLLSSTIEQRGYYQLQYSLRHIVMILIYKVFQRYIHRQSTSRKITYVCTINLAIRDINVDNFRYLLCNQHVNSRKYISTLILWHKKYRSDICLGFSRRIYEETEFFYLCRVLIYKHTLYMISEIVLFYKTKRYSFITETFPNQISKENFCI